MNAEEVYNHFGGIDKFLNYVEAHSQTPRALFHRDHVNALLLAAGQKPMESPEKYAEFGAVHWWTAESLIKEARERLRKHERVAKLGLRIVPSNSS